MTSDKWGAAAQFPGQGTKIPHATGSSQEFKNKTKFLSCGKI